jgi:hypothetical protein
MSENHPPFNLFEGKVRQMIYPIEKALLKLKKDYRKGKVSREDYIKNLQDLALLYITDEGTNRVETIA